MELEYKFELENARRGEAVLAAFEEGLPGARVLSRREIGLEAQYFDTPDWALREAGYALRLRGENEKKIVCLKFGGKKAAAGLTSREELECEAADLYEGLAKLRALGAPQALFALCAQGLRVTARVHAERTACLVRFGSTDAELAFDRGYFAGDPSRFGFYELELEFKAGSEAEFLRFAEGMKARFALRPQEKSKLARALEAEKAESQNT